MKALFIGNCQLKAVINVLKSSILFNNQYKEVIFFYSDQVTIKEVNQIINDILPHTTLVISQSSINDDNILKFLYQNVEYNNILHYHMINCYFTGYDPLAADKNICHCNCFICPTLCYTKLLNGNIKKACRKWCDPDAFTKDIVITNYQNSIKQLQLEESNLDINISDFIEQNYQNVFLFHNYNHPTNYVLIELAKRILRKLNMHISIIEKHQEEFLGKISFPPAPSVYINLNLNFAYPSFVIDNKIYDTRETMILLSKKIHELQEQVQEQLTEITKKSKESLTLLDNISNYNDDNKIYIKNQKVNIKYAEKIIIGYLNKIHDNIKDGKFSLKLNWKYAEKEFHQLKFELEDLWSLWSKKQDSKVIVIINSKLVNMEYNIVHDRNKKTSTLTFLDKSNLDMCYAGEIRIEIIIVENNSIWITNFDNDYDNILRS